LIFVIQIRQNLVVEKRSCDAHADGVGFYLKKGMSRDDVEEIMGKPISESIMETNWGSSRAVKFYPHGVKKGDVILSYPFINIFMRAGVLSKAAEVAKFD